MIDRRALLLPVVLASLLVAACSGGGGGDPKQDAAAYPTAVQAWRQSALDPAVAAARAATFSDLMVAGRLETTTERAAQKSRCRAVRDARTAVDALAPPALDDKGDDASVRLRADLTARTTAYREAVGPALEQVATFCTWYGRTVETGARRTAAEKVITALGQKPGVDPTTRFRCSSPTGCVPVDPAKLPAYLAALKTKLDVLRESLDVYAGVSTPCPLPELAPLCALYLKQAPASLAAEQAAYDAIANAFRTGVSTSRNAVIARTSAAANALSARSRKEADTIYVGLARGASTTRPGDQTRIQVTLLQRYEKVVATAPVP